MFLDHFLRYVFLLRIFVYSFRLHLSMALVERMSILGIRSFDHETMQKIEFFTPVTLILGHNGTGKTEVSFCLQTIIECLKYATTGDLPPGSKTGCSFIHDPRVARETEVKAKVTLQIRDVQGQPMVISRALVATQRDKNKQGTLKTLDGSIKRQLPDGRHTSISSKCAELDSEMITSLGVSKAVLENVIFCHQEDSNWPLQEAKTVKQRFDDLFASSRYVKALDAIRKCKQEKDSNIRIYKTELKHLGKSREEANKLRNERQNLQQSIANKQRTLTSVQQKLDPVVVSYSYSYISLLPVALIPPCRSPCLHHFSMQERLNLYKQKYAELINIQAEIKSCETEKSHLDESVHNLVTNIKSEFEGTDEELATIVENADAELDRKQLDLTRLDGTIQSNRVKLRDAESQRNKLSIEIAQLEMQVKHLKDGISTRDNLLISALRQYNLPVFDDLPATEEQVANATRHLNSLMRSMDASETELKVL
ncbi:DNA repair protein RAD50 [Paragonimus westermani]|uniref:DNA repair protein RAD50 n=1 Tax=Paragonimus westermani TaxID=34504 RepID=A0A5J4N9P8_9TREM|nr:DNA repair protein RAD50 [Paragonimus westermani]